MQTQIHIQIHIQIKHGDRDSLSARTNVFKRKRKHQNLAGKDFPYHKYISIIVHSLFDTATNI